MPVRKAPTTDTIEIFMPSGTFERTFAEVEVEVGVEMVSRWI